MKIAIVGSRGYRDLDFLGSKVMSLFHNSKLTAYVKEMDHEFVSGGSSVKDDSGMETSVDKYAEDIIDNLNKIYSKIYPTPIKKYIFLPDWKKYGRSAGFKRNKQIVEHAEKVIAFWDGKSKGTKNSIDLAVEKGIPVDIYIRN